MLANIPMTKVIVPAIIILYLMGYLLLRLSGIMYNDTSVGFSQVLPYYAKDKYLNVDLSDLQIRPVSMSMTLYFPIIYLENNARNAF
jgi:hypothetical protein